MALRELLALFKVDVDGGKLDEVDKKLDHAAENAEGLGEQFEKLKTIAEGALAALGVERAIEGAENLAKQSSEVGHLSDALGVSSDSLQAWQAVAEESGGSAEAVATTFKILSENAYQASKGNAEAGASFKALGVNVKGADGQLRPIDQILADVGGKLAELPNATERVAIGTKVLGRGVLGLLPAFGKGKAGLDELLASVGAGGAVFDKDFIEQAEEGVKVSAAFQRAISRLEVGFAKLLLPAIDKVKDVLKPYADEITKMLGDHDKVQAILTTLAIVGVPVLITALGGLGVILESIGVFAVEAFAPFLVLAAIGLLVEDLIVFLEGGDSALGSFLDTMFGAGSAEIILKGIKDAWASVVEWIGIASDVVEAWWPVVSEVLGDVWDFAVEVFQGLISSAGDFGEFIWTLCEEVGAAFAQGWAIVSDIVNSVIALMTGDFDGFETDVIDAATRIVDFLESAFTGAGHLIGGIIDGILNRVDAAGDAVAALASGDFSGAASAAGRVVTGEVAPAGAGVDTKSTVVTDQRVLNVNVTGASANNPGAVGREVGAAVSNVMSQDRSQILASVG